MMRARLHMFLGWERDRADSDDGARPGADSGVGAYLDALTLRDAVLSDDVVLEEPADGEFVIHQVVGCRAHRLGHYHGAIDAWRALDELDDPHLIAGDRPLLIQ